MKLAKALLGDGTEPSRSEAGALLAPLALDGKGEAMALLAVADPEVTQLQNQFSMPAPPGSNSGVTFLT